MKILPAINWRMADICNAGTSATVILLATQVVPQMVLVANNAR